MNHRLSFSTAAVLSAPRAGPPVAAPIFASRKQVLRPATSVGLAWGAGHTPPCAGWAGAFGRGFSLLSRIDHVQGLFLR